jgi:hypothetical protein
MLMHSMMSKPGVDDSATRGIHGFSVDGRNWSINPDPLWETDVTWTNGSTTHFYRRQAPTLYFDEEGAPVLLQTAVDHLEPAKKSGTRPEGSCWWGRGWTFAQPISS